MLKYRALLALGALAGCSDGPDLGYVLGVETAQDLTGLYAQVGQLNSCLQRVESGHFVAEFFRYAPCDQAPRGLETPVASVPGSCASSYHDGIPRTGEFQWCLVGPHIEPSPYPGTDEEEWCRGTWWLESAFDYMPCSEGPARIADIQGLIDSGELDVEASCYAVDPVSVIGASIAAMCP